MNDASWLEFKAKHDEPGKEPCPFCGIRHTPAKAHPHCDMATRFKFWLECHNQSGIGAM